MTKASHSEHGFTISELLVSIGLFSIFGLSVVSVLSSSFRELGIENRAAIVNQELRNAMNLLSTEARMASSLSPYIPGTNPEDVTCSSDVTVTDNSVSFLVVHDDENGSNGLKPYFVGYTYKASTRELLRGEVEGSSTTNCIVPAGDPTSSAVAQVVAKNVFPIDNDGDGTLDPVFSYSSPALQVNLEMRVVGANDVTVAQSVNADVLLRTM